MSSHSHTPPQSRLVHIQVHVDVIDQLFNSIDPAPFHVRELDADAHAYIVHSAKALPRDARMELVLHIDSLPSDESKLGTVSQAIQTHFSGKAPRRSGPDHATIVPYGRFRTKDGDVLFGIQNEREWATFCEKVLLDASLAKDARFDSVSKRSSDRATVKALIEKAFSTLSAPEVEARLDEAGIGYGRMNDMADLWAHPQLKARQRWQTVGSPAGDIPALLPPGRSNAFEYRMDPVPAVGQHTEAILRELGQSDAAIAALRASSAV